MILIYVKSIQECLNEGAVELLNECSVPVFFTGVNLMIVS